MTFELVHPRPSMVWEKEARSEKQVKEMLKRAKEAGKDIPPNNPYTHNPPASLKVATTVARREHPIFKAVTQFRQETIKKVIPPKKG